MQMLAQLAPPAIAASAALQEQLPPFTPWGRLCSSRKCCCVATVSRVSLAVSKLQVRAAAALDQQNPPAQQSGSSLQEEDTPQQLLAALAATSSYNQLSSLVMSQQQMFLHTPLCVYALLHAVQLRDTLSDENIGKGNLTTEQQVLEQMSVVELLLDQLSDAAAAQLPHLPLQTQGTVALALAQLDYYHAPTFNTVADTVLLQLADKLKPQVLQLGPAAASAAEHAASGDALSSSSSSSSDGKGVEEAALGRSVALSDLPRSLVPGVLLSLSVAMSLNGHYNAALMDAIAEQALAFRSSFPDAAPLISISAALLDQQHCCPALLAAAAQAAVQQEASLEQEEVISLLLALAFFRVEAPDFVSLAMEALATNAQSLMESEPLQLSRLWKALLLLRVQGLAPPVLLLQVLEAVSQQVPDLLLLGSCKSPLDLADLQEELQGADDIIRQQWEEAGLLLPVEILQALQQLGYIVDRRVEVPAALMAQVETAGAVEELQQPFPSALVDVCMTLQDQRKVAVLVLDEGRYCNAPASRLRGAAAVDVLVLQALGLTVLPLPVLEWQTLGGDVAQQQRYLKARLAAAIG